MLGALSTQQAPWVNELAFIEATYGVVLSRWSVRYTGAASLEMCLGRDMPGHFSLVAIVPSDYPLRKPFITPVDREGALTDLEFIELTACMSQTLRKAQGGTALARSVEAALGWLGKRARRPALSAGTNPPETPPWSPGACVRYPGVLVGNGCTTPRGLKPPTTVTGEAAKAALGVTQSGAPRQPRGGGSKAGCEWPVLPRTTTSPTDSTRGSPRLSSERSSQDGSPSPTVGTSCTWRWGCVRECGKLAEGSSEADSSSDSSSSSSESESDGDFHLVAKELTSNIQKVRRHKLGAAAPLWRQAAT